MVFMDATKQAFTTLSFPERVSLASVRCRSLLLFELQHYRNVMGAMPQRRGLNLRKLTVKVEGTPANIVPYMGSERKVRCSLHDSLDLHAEDDSLYEAFMLPSGCINKEEMLKKRRELLIEKEKSFVYR